MYLPMPMPRYMPVMMCIYCFLWINYWGATEGGGTVVRYVGLIPSVLQNDDLFNKEHSVCVLFGWIWQTWPCPFFFSSRVCYGFFTWVWWNWQNSEKFRFRIVSFPSLTGCWWHPSRPFWNSLKGKAGAYMIVQIWIWHENSNKQYEMHMVVNDSFKWSILYLIPFKTVFLPHPPVTCVSSFLSFKHTCQNTLASQ